MRSVDVEAGVCEPLLVRAREERVEYYMEHGHDVFYILTNASDHHYYQVTYPIPPSPFTYSLKVMTAASNQPSYWSSYYQPPHGVSPTTTLSSGSFPVLCSRLSRYVIAPFSVNGEMCVAN